MFLMKMTGPASIGDFFWWENNAVVEVPEDLGWELLGLAPGDYRQVPPPAPRVPEVPPPAPESPVADSAGSPDVDPLDDGPLGFEPAVVDAAMGAVPEGIATEVLDWVGDSPERAKAAIVAEYARGDGARTSLIAKLEKVERSA
jgi:hypothetical protein